MELKTRKIAFIKEFLRLQSEEAIYRFETLLKKEMESDEGSKGEPMSIKEYNRRIDLSLEDAERGDIISEEEMDEHVASWLREE